MMLGYAELWKAVGEKKIQLSAFYARNLLELLVWAKYCLASEENSIRFNQDDKRDMDGLHVVAGKLAEFAAQTPEGMEELKTKVPDLYKYLERLDELVARDVSFKPVSEAAAEVGPDFAIVYRTLNKLLS